MARIRYTHNSFSTGFISKKVQGNVNFEGYNDGLVECTNFIIQHTGGCFKRGGTEFINHTKNDEQVLLIPFYFSGEESYMCEFGEGYIRFYTKYGPLRDNDGEIYESDVSHYFNLAAVRKASTYQNGNVMTLVMIEGIFTLTRVSQDPVEFKVEQHKFTYPPLTPINYLSDTEVSVTKNDDTYTVIPYSKDNDSHIPDEKYAPFFYDSDKDEVFVINVTSKEGSEKKYSLRITEVKEYSGNFKEILCKWDPNLNSGQPEPEPEELTGEFLEWQISRFSLDRVKNLGSIGVGLYEGRLFLGAENLVWGSSLVMQDLLDFKPGTNPDDAVAFVLTETESDNILWMAGHSKLFPATAGGLFMAGAVTFNDTAITAENFRVRLFEKLGASLLKPVTALNTIFFVDNTGINVHEIVLSAETGVYQSNDLSLIGNDLTRSGIIAHTWQQSPIKTYWCATEDGFLCSLTYLKNNGIMAWAKHVIGGKNVKIESLANMHYQKSDTIWMIVKRQVNGKIVRSIEYIHNIYDPLAQEEFKQFFVDSGKIKEKKHTIMNIEKSTHYSIKTEIDIRAAAGMPDAQELKLLIRMDPMHTDPAPGGKPYNPFCEYVPLTARNFQKTDEGPIRFDVYENFDYIRTLNPDGTMKYESYPNPDIIPILIAK